MTTYIASTSGISSGEKNSNRGFIDVISSVVSRPSIILYSCRSMAKFSLWPEGTDPALRGRKGRWGTWQIMRGIT